MAYGLKYYKELTQPNGKVVRLEILEKGYEGASKEIGPVCQALRLDIQGDTEIDAPIVKTSLSMTFVDAPDHADARTKKCGNWDEFYTSDATLWRVVLKARNAQETAFATIWGGYITPDSYTEVLQYRGSVTLVARDNIGHLSDFPFDAEGNADGMISLIELIRGAWDKIESPMTLDDQAVANADWMLSDGVYAYDTYMNVSAFEDMNWYDALESALYAYGLVLRYTGNNNVSFYSLRNLPRMGAHEVEDISFVEPTFMSGAERELTPAVKRIEEAVEYEIVEQKTAPMGESVTFTGASSTIPFESKNIFGEKEWKNIPTWPIDNTTNEGWGNDKSKTLFFSPKAYGNNSFGNELYIATNTDGSGSVWYGQHIQGKSFAFTLSFGQLIERIGSGGITPIYLLPITVKKVNVVISASANGVTSYLNAGGSWQTSEAVLSLDIDEEARTATKDIALGAFSLDESLVKITIKNITLGAKSGEEWWDTSAGLGIYVAINALTFTNSNGEPLCETNRVNTNYDAKNNIILSRDPKIAPALNDVLFPSIIKNGIFVKEGRTYNPAKTWYWGGQTPQQMAVYNHLQLLCYHAKPNNILRGTIVNADVTDMQVIWMWHGAEHMLVSGTLDLISGYIENAVLREFARYEDMWGMLEPADMPEVEGKSSTNVEGGVAASNEGARMTSTTTVNIGGGGGSIVLDTFMSDTSTNGVQNRVIKAYVDDMEEDVTEAYKAAISALNIEIQGILETMNTNIGKNATGIESLATRVKAEEDVTETYKEWWADLKKWVTVEGDNVKISTNLIVTGDTSSGGSGEDTPASGTVTGIKVSSTQTLEPNTAGVIDMVDTLASIDVSDQLTAYAKTADVNSALALKQDTISDLATIRSGAALGATALQSITKSMVDSVLGGTTSSNANKFLMCTGSTTVWSAVTKTMVTDALGYTPYNSTNPNGYISGITKSMVASALGASTGGRYLIDTGGDVSWGTIPTKLSQFTDDVVSGKYLLLAGGTIEGTNMKPLTINTTASAFEIQLQSKGNTKVYVGWNSTTDGAFFQEGTSTKYIGIKTDGTPYFHDTAYHTLIHSGNYATEIGDYYLKSSGGTISGTSVAPLLINTSASDSSIVFQKANASKTQIGYSSSIGSFIYNYASGKSLGIKDDGTPHYNSNTLIHSGNIGSYNAGSATKLQTARTIWGRSFDGTSDVNGNIFLGQKVIYGGKTALPRNMIDCEYENALILGYGIRNDGTMAYYAQKHVFRIGDTDTLTINSSGNVTIGASDLAGTSAKLSVNGSFTMWGAYQNEMPTLGDFTNARFKLYGYGNRTTQNWGLFAAAMNSGKAYLQVGGDFGDTLAYSLLLNPLGGNVGIGTTSPAYKLDVAGTGRFTGDVTINGNLIVKGDTSSGGAGQSASVNGPVNISVGALFNIGMGSAQNVTQATMDSHGLTMTVVNNIMSGLYTKAVDISRGYNDVWSYDGYDTESHIYIFFRQGDGFDIHNGVSLSYNKSTAKWYVIAGEI